MSLTTKLRALKIQFILSLESFLSLSSISSKIFDVSMFIIQITFLKNESKLTYLRLGKKVLAKFTVKFVWLSFPNIDFKIFETMYVFCFCQDHLPNLRNKNS